MVSTSQFRKIALGFPGSALGSHFDVVDFRVGSRIFATLREADSRAVLKLAPDQQMLLLQTSPASFEPVPGSWGMKGWTRVMLDRTDAPALRHAMAMARRSVAPKRLQNSLEGSTG